jgi:IclR family KDG regulon transcriptional repressor
MYPISISNGEERILKESLESAHIAVGPVERVLNLLICFQSRTDGLTLTELAHLTDLAPSTTARLLKVLERYQFVRRDADRLYRLGPQVIQLGLGALRDMSLYDVVRPHLRILAEETGESAHLGIPGGEGNVLYVDQVSSRHTVQTVTWVGRTVPIAETAIGLALLGQLLPAGYVSRRHTVEPDVSSVAAPIFDKNNHIVGAINVIGPSYRISDQQLIQFGLLIAEHTRQISNKLGALLL